MRISYPAVDVGSYVSRDDAVTTRVLDGRGLVRDGYVLFLSRLAAAKGVDDLIDGYARSAAATDHRLVIAGSGPDAQRLHAYAAASPAAGRITFLDDVSDDEKVHLMAGCAAFVLPSKPRPEFVGTFGIALVEKMLSGGGPVITTGTGGIPEAVGDCALTVPVEDPDAIAVALDRALGLSAVERREWEERARAYASRFDRAAVLDAILEQIELVGTSSGRVQTAAG